MHISKAKWSITSVKMIMSNFMMHMLGRNIEYQVRAEGPPHHKTFIASLTIPIGEKLITGEGTGSI